MPDCKVSARSHIFFVVAAHVLLCPTFDNSTQRETRVYKVLIVLIQAPFFNEIELNAVLRRIDLFCKLVAPVIISAFDAYSTIVAIWTVLGQNLLSAAVEYYAIAQVRLSPVDDSYCVNTFDTWRLNSLLHVQRTLIRMDRFTTSPQPYNGNLRAYR
jgi:hypothetical protein